MAEEKEKCMICGGEAAHSVHLPYLSVHVCCECRNEMPVEMVGQTPCPEYHQESPGMTAEQQRNIMAEALDNAR